MLVLVFSPHCRFSVRVAPHVNALARAFPLLEVGAVDATRHRGVAHKFGVAGVPSLVLLIECLSLVPLILLMLVMSCLL